MKTQEELKEEFRNILSTEVWKSRRMVDYCVKEADYFVELSNGNFISIDKPKIETSFCFGYSDSRYDTR